MSKGTHFAEVICESCGHKQMVVLPRRVVKRSQFGISRFRDAEVANLYRGKYRLLRVRRKNISVGYTVGLVVPMRWASFFSTLGPDSEAEEEYFGQDGRAAFKRFRELTQ